MKSVRYKSFEESYSVITRVAQSIFFGDRIDNRGQIDVAVGNVHDDHAVGIQVLQVNLKRFVGQQMDRRGIAGERVECQNVEVLWLAGGQFLLEGETGVGQDHVVRPSQSSRNVK